tara:strand:- start:56 stop:796 length:741 start_codon:yes stop_codon:yes gene_type:complete
MEKNISVIVPAYNEEKHIRNTILHIKEGLKKINEYEILVFNDSSTDNTRLILDEISKKDKKVKIFHNNKNKGMGFNFLEGVKVVKYDYMIMIPGDDDIPAGAISYIMDHMGKADVINPYFTNGIQVRSIFRIIISELFVLFMNLMMGLNIKYYTGVVLYRSDLIRKIDVKSHGATYQAEILTKLLRSGSSFMEIGIKQTGNGSGSSNFFNLTNVFGTTKTILSLFWDIRIKNRRKYNKKLTRIKKS